MANARFIWTAFILAVLAVLVAGIARADSYGKQTVFTFNRPYTRVRK